MKPLVTKSHFSAISFHTRKTFLANNHHCLPALITREHHFNIGIISSRCCVSKSLKIFQQIRFVSKGRRTIALHENIYTLPNFLTASRILACPFLGWSILEGNFALATGLLTYAGVSDWVNLTIYIYIWYQINYVFLTKVDGYLARRFKMKSVLGTILDPAADKILMTTLIVTLAMKDLIPSKLSMHAISIYPEIK